MATHMEDIKVIVSDAYCRKPFTKLDTLIDTKWKQEVTKNPRLYNGKKFRIDHVEMQKGGDPTLFVGLTDYKNKFNPASFLQLKYVIIMQYIMQK